MLLDFLRTVSCSTPRSIDHAAVRNDEVRLWQPKYSIEPQIKVPNGVTLM